MCRLMLCGWVIAWLLGTGLAQEPAGGDDAQELRRRVNQLVRQLFSDELAQRDQAEKDLLELGADILELLPATTNRTPAEVRQRLTRVVSQLESSAAESTVTPALATLSGEMSLQEAFRALEDQTANRAIGFEELSGQITLDWDQKEYWPAMDQLLDAAGLDVSTYSETASALTLMARPAEQRARLGSAQYNGVFRFETIRMLASRDLRNPAVQGLRATLQIAWEPRVSPVSISQTVESLKVIDDRGNEISVAAQGMLGASVQAGMSAVELDLPLALPDRSAAKIASLSGEIVALIPGRLETFQFDDDLEQARSVQMRKAGVTVILDRVRQNGALYQVHVRLRFDDAAGSLQSHYGWVYRNDAYLVTPDGQRVDSSGLEATRQGDDEVGIAYLFSLEDGLQGCRFVYRTPAMILSRVVKFELKDIDLP